MNLKMLCMLRPGTRAYRNPVLRSFDVATALVYDLDHVQQLEDIVMVGP